MHDTLKIVKLSVRRKRHFRLLNSLDQRVNKKKYVQKNFSIFFFFLFSSRPSHMIFQQSCCLFTNFKHDKNERRGKTRRSIDIFVIIWIEHKEDNVHWTDQSVDEDESFFFPSLSIVDLIFLDVKWTVF